MVVFSSPDSDVSSSFLEAMCQCSDCRLVLGSVDHLQRLPCVLDWAICHRHHTYVKFYILGQIVSFLPKKPRKNKVVFKLMC